MPKPIAKNPPAPRSRVTQIDNARALGTDRSTVSRVMNAGTRSLISPDMVERVLRAASEMGYRPNLAAASLRTSRSHSIGVVITDVVNPFFPPLLMSIEAAIEDAGYLPIVASARGSEDRQDSIVENLIARQVDGKKYQIALLLQPTPLHALEELGKHNEVMPQKSTYFYPKLATGMVINPLK